MSPGDGAYNSSFAWTVRTPVDSAALASALHLLALRHPTMRATYDIRDGEVVQLVSDSPAPIFEEVAADAWDSSDVMAEMEREIYRPFALDREPPIRWRLYRRESDDPILVLAAHHIGADGWSLMTILDEVRQLYAAEISGTPAELPEFALDSADFVARQEQWLASKKGEAQLQYWKQRLAGDIPSLDLHTDFPRPPNVGVKMGLVRLDLSAELAAGLLGRAEELGVSPFTFFVTAYQVLLRRLTGQEDFCVGVPTAGRPRKFGHLFNYFVNAVPLRATFEGEPTFKDFLLRQSVLIGNDLRRRDYPFSELLGQLDMSRDPGRAPLIQTQFVWENWNAFERKKAPIVSMEASGTEIWDLGDLQLERLPINLTLDHFDVDLKVVQVGEHFYLQNDYNSELFEAASMLRLLRSFECLLQSNSTRPGDPHRGAVHPTKRRSELGGRNLEPNPGRVRPRRSVSPGVCQARGRDARAHGGRVRRPSAILRRARVSRQPACTLPARPCLLMVTAALSTPGPAAWCQAAAWALWCSNPWSEPWPRATTSMR